MTFSSTFNTYIGYTGFSSWWVICMCIQRTGYPVVSLCHITVNCPFYSLMDQGFDNATADPNNSIKPDQAQSSNRVLVWLGQYKWSGVVVKVFLGRHHSGSLLIGSGNPPLSGDNLPYLKREKAIYFLFVVSLSQEQRNNRKGDWNFV